MFRAFFAPLLLLTSMVSNAQSSAFVFDGTGQQGPLGQQLGILEDPSGGLSPEQADTSEYEPCLSEVPNLGISPSVFWLKLRFENRSAFDNLVLSLPHPELDEVDVYLDRAGKPVHLMSAGQSRPVSAKFGAYDSELATLLPLKGEETATVLLRVSSMKQLQVPVLLRGERAHVESRSKRNMVIGLYSGVMLVLILYNFFIWFALRQRTYLQYVVYLLLVALTQLTFSGIAPAYLWPDSTWLSAYSSLILTLATATAGSQFTRSFLNTSHTVKKLDHGIRLFYLVFAVTTALYLCGMPHLGYQIAQAVSGLFAFYIFFLAFRVWRRGSRQAGYFLIAWTVFLTGTMVFVLKDAGVLPYNDITIYTMPLGSAIEGILLSFGLADRIHVLRKEKERSQAAELAASLENERIIRDQNAILEQKVTERTHELVEANEEIKRTQVQLVNAEKMAGLGQLTAGIAHEINNPINFINSNIPPLRRNLQDMVEVLADFRAVTEDGSAGLKAAHEKCRQLELDLSIAELDGMIASIDDGARRTAEIVKGLRNFSRLDEDAVKKADINEGVRSTIGLLSPQIKGRVVINTALADLPQADCHPGKLNQAVMNLVTNAAQAVRAKHGDAGDGVVSIRTWHENGIITIAVQDNGCGIEEAIKSRIFEPFFTTKGVGEGTGLGLSITYSIVQKHNGTIAVESTVGQGSEFRISIPVVQQEEKVAMRA
ncbi:MAG: 7TM diverse intracellular signaling domain-containing protein [Flavobacteriales bacterium]